MPSRRQIGFVFSLPINREGRRERREDCVSYSAISTHINTKNLTALSVLGGRITKLALIGFVFRPLTPGYVSITLLDRRGYGN